MIFVQNMRMKFRIINFKPAVQQKEKQENANFSLTKGNVDDRNPDVIKRYPELTLIDSFIACKNQEYNYVVLDFMDYN